MRMYDIIKKKRDGLALSEREIGFFVNGYTKGEIPDYQASALLMAIWFRGMSAEETAALTLAIRGSGETLHFSGIEACAWISIPRAAWGIRPALPWLRSLLLLV